MKIFTLVVLLNFVLGFSPAYAKTPGEIAIGGYLRDTELQGLSGPSRKFSEFRGKPLVINVWASWCGPCREEMGSLERLSRRFQGRLVVIGISTDDYPDRAISFLKKSGTTFSHFIDRNLLLENMLGADRIPLTVLVDAQGRVLGKYYGAKAWDSPEAVALIERTLEIRK